METYLKDFEGYIERMQEIRLLSKPDLEEIDAHLSEVLTNLLVDDIDIAESSSKDDRVLAMAGKVKRDYASCIGSYKNRSGHKE
ncbi:MAG: hypothetical protein K6E85_07735 [Lachnospiraceae bacterium]|nr:hypothetical protein [Lachnospiraceae bacterium]